MNRIKRQAEIKAKMENWEVEKYMDFNEQYIKRMTIAVESDDPWEAVRVMSKAERLIRPLFADCHELIKKAHQELAEDMRNFHRMARRILIRKTLRGSLEEFPDDIRDSVHMDLEKAEVIEDFKAVKAHLEQGTRLFAGVAPSRAELKKALQ